MAKSCPPPYTRFEKQPHKWDQMGGNGIFSAEHQRMRHYFHLFNAASVVLSVQGSFYNESAIVSAPDLDDRRHLCRCLIPLSLIAVVSMSTRRLARVSRKLTQSDSCPHILRMASTPVSQSLYKVCSVNVAFTMTEELSQSPQRITWPKNTALFQYSRTTGNDALFNPLYTQNKKENVAHRTTRNRSLIK